MISEEWTAELEMSLCVYELQVANQLLHLQIDQARSIVRQALAVLQGRLHILPIILRASPAAACLASSMETLPTDWAIQTAGTQQELRDLLLGIYRTEKLFLRKMEPISHGIF